MANTNLNTKELCVFHCIIHQQNLCAKAVKFFHVMSTVINMCINFIKSRTLNHQQFKELLDDMEVEYGNLVYYCEVSWLSKGNMLKRFYDLRN